MITLANPWLLLLLPLPLLLHYLLPPATFAEQDGLKVPFYSWLTRIPATGRTAFTLTWQKYVIAFFIWGLLVLALSGPEWLGEKISLSRAGRNIMLLIDLSGSMSTPDYTFGGKNTQRIDIVKKIAGDFILHRQGDRIGLIFFGTKPYLRSPLTYDLHYVNSALQDASIGLAGINTAIGDGIALAVKRLQHEDKNSRVMILLTDGASNSGDITPAQAADLAARFGIRIYTIGIGADSLVVQTPLGPQTMPVNSDLDETTLTQIATITGGQFFRAKNTEALSKVYQNIDKLEPVTTGNDEMQPVKQLYYWPLAIAFLLSIIIALRRVWHS